LRILRAVGTLLFPCLSKHSMGGLTEVRRGACSVFIETKALDLFIGTHSGTLKGVGFYKGGYTVDVWGCGYVVSITWKWHVKPEYDR